MLGWGALKSWRCRMSRGSGCARSWSSTHRRSCCPRMCSAMAVSLAVWREISQRACRVCPDPQPSDPETERYLLLSAVAGLLAEVAGSVPVCVVLDDLHWADGQSVALLKHLVRTVERGGTCS